MIDFIHKASKSALAFFKKPVVAILVVLSIFATLSFNLRGINDVAKIALAASFSTFLVAALFYILLEAALSVTAELTTEYKDMDLRNLRRVSLLISKGAGGKLSPKVYQYLVEHKGKPFYVYQLMRLESAQSKFEEITDDRNRQEKNLDDYENKLKEVCVKENCNEQ